MGVRTDLAMEAREILKKSGREDIPGVTSRTYDSGGFAVTEVCVLNKDGERALSKPCGKYVTVEIGRLIRREDDAFRLGAEALSGILRDLLDMRKTKTVLVVGIGNPLMTPDALGPLTLRSILVTRHLREKFPDQFSRFRSVCALEPGVLGTTGMESATVIHAVAEKTKPDAVIAVDALASRKTERVCRTVQLSDTGITPGSGVGNGRVKINSASFGVPVIAVGVPTVVDAATLAADMAEEAGVGRLDRETLENYGGGLIVTPRDIDASVRGIAKLVGYGINLALHDGLTVEDVDMFLG